MIPPLALSQSFRRCVRKLVLGIVSMMSFSVGSAEQSLPTIELSKPRQTGAPIQFELWSWADDEASRAKLRDLKDGEQIPLDALPDLVQFRFRILGDHQGVDFQGRSADGEHKLGWMEKELKDRSEAP